MAEQRTRRVGRLALLLGLIGSHIAIGGITNPSTVSAANPIPDAGLPEVLVAAEAIVSERTEPLAAGVTGVSKVNDSFPQMDTEVLAIAEHDGIMYIGGKFTQVEIAATGQTFAQPFLAAFERETGEWISSFTPTINGNVWDLKVTDDGQLIVAGQFRNVDGAPNTAGIAMIDLATGQVNPDWSVNLVVTGTTRWALGRALDIEGDLLYIAGNFTRVTGTNGVTNSVGQMVRVNLATGNVDGSFLPNFDGIVFDVDAIGDKVYAVGNYFYTNGQWTLGQTTLQASDGQLYPGQNAPVRVAANVSRNYQQAILSLGTEVWMTGSEHNTHVYSASNYGFLRGFVSMPLGDGQALAELNGIIYKGSHANPNTYEYADTIVYPSVTGWTSRKPVKWVGAWDAEVGGSHDHTDWYPQVGVKTGEGGWELFADSVECLWAGGDFDRGSYDGNTPRYVGGFARFCTTDDVAPGVPSDLVADVTNNGVNLSWTGTEDDRKGLVRYELLKNDSIFATYVGTTTFRDPNGAASDRYFVRSIDYTGNRSATTPVAVAQDDTEAPTVPQNVVAADLGAGAVALSWDASTDDRALDGYIVFEDGAEVERVDTPGLVLRFRDAGAHSYEVAAFDRSGNRSVNSATASVVVTGDAESNSQAPSTPTNVVATVNVDDGVDVSWTASTDDGVVAEYVVLADGLEVGRSASTSLTVVSPPAGADLYQVVAIDEVGNRSAASVAFEIDGGGGNPETEAPSTPTGVVGSVGPDDDVLLSWTVSTDNVGVVEYVVFSNGVEIDRVSGLSATIPTPGFGSKWYQVKALDAAGNASALSSAVKVAVTEDDVTKPSGPTDLVGVIEANGDVTLTWTASTDNVGVAEYIVFRNGIEIERVVDPTAIVPAPAVGAHWYQVRAVDAAGNQSWMTPSTRIDIAAPPEDDTTRPSGPTDLLGVIEANGDVTLTWTASTDNVGVTEYIVFRNGTEIDRVVNPTAVIPAPSLGSHWYQVRAADAAGNESWKTPSFKVVIIPPPGQDATRPSTPRDLVGVIEANGDVTLTWTASTDNVGVTEYIVFRNAVEIDRVVDPTTVVPAPAVGSHWYQVRAIDAAGNESFKTPSTRIDIAGGPVDDVTKPTGPQDLLGVIEANGDVTLTWTASTDNVGVAEYIVFRNGIEIDRVVDPTAIVPAPAVGAHWYQVRAADAAGNLSWRTPSFRVDIASPPGDDVTNPTGPRDLLGVIEANGDVTLTWTASSDNVGVTEYIVFRNAVEIDRVVNPTTVVPAPAVGSHWYQVRAVDAAGNQSWKTPSFRVDI